MVRKRWALSQRELAQLLGYKSRVSISRIENCEARPTAEALLALEVIFGKRPLALFPKFYDEVEDLVVGALYKLQQRLEDDESDTQEIQKKRQLVAEALSRAVLRPKQQIDHEW
jgi:transcriptional regulator with XRE-family HTH domain